MSKHSTTAQRATERKLLTKNVWQSRKIFSPDACRDLSAQSLSMLLSTGTVIGGTFKILSTLGQGGMGVVYAVEHLGLNKPFALKILAPDLVSEHNWKRFQVEAKILAGLRHDAMVNVYDLGLHEQILPYYSMDFLRGRSLEEILSASGPLTLERTIDIYLSVLDGLAYAHRVNVIHRDLKPGNIMLCQDEQGENIKILDFGIAKLLGSQSQLNLTLAGETFGSPFYMSPEQCAAEAVDARSDIYSIGCAIFETLTTFVPFEGSTPLETVQMHERDKPPSLLKLVPEANFPRALDDVLAKCLAKRPDDRYQSAKELAIDLERIQSGKTPQAVLQAENKMSIKEDSGSSSYQTKEQRMALAPNFALIALAMLGLLFVGGAAFIFYFSHTKFENLFAGFNFSPARPAISVHGQGFPAYDSLTETAKYSMLEPIDGKLCRSFRFPKDCLIGKIGPFPKLNETVDAKGYLYFPKDKALVFQPAAIIADYPQYAGRFQSGDVPFIQIEIVAGDKMLKSVTKVPGVLHLILNDGSALTPACVNDLSNFTSLVSFTAYFLELDGATLAKADCWKNLYHFCWCDARSPQLMLRKLAASNNLISLELRGGGLNSENYAAIANLTKLKKLSIPENKLTTADLDKLAALKQLLYLDLYKSNVDENFISSLKKFKSLTHVVFEGSAFDLNRRQRFASALPDVKFIWF